MEFKVITGDIAQTAVDAILVPHFEAEHLEEALAKIDAALGGAVSQLAKEGEIKGKFKEVTIIHTLGKLPAGRVVVVGMGKLSELSGDKVREVVAETCRQLRRKGVSTIASNALGVAISGIDYTTAAQVMVEGAYLGLYCFRKHMTKKNDGEIKEFTIVEADKRKMPLLRRGCSRGKTMAEATSLARDMVNEPSNYMTPTNMAEMAEKLSQTYGLEIQVFDREQMREMGMGALLGVAQGSHQPPKLIVLKYRGRVPDEVDIALVGKGITFDSGGISLKPSEKMEEMKGDMAGGAAVMAALSAISQFKPAINVVAVIPSTENLPGGSALKPGDVLTAMNGKTIEVISTDAEGRLILADALSYARKLKAKVIIDVATLTGACHTALGDIYSGGFTNNQKLMDRVIAAGNEAGDLIWQLPMHEKYNEQIKSDVADMKNTGGRWGGAITGAKFLAEYVGDTPWVHLDIAGTFLSEKEDGYLVKGATGVPVRTLINLVLSQVK